MRAQTPVIFDATHSVQEPGGLGGKTGNRTLVEPLARGGRDRRRQLVFRDAPGSGPGGASDGPNMIPLGQFAGVLDRLLRLRAVVEEGFGRQGSANQK